MNIHIDTPAQGYLALAAYIVRQAQRDLRSKYRGESGRASQFLASPWGQLLQEEVNFTPHKGGRKKRKAI